ncbi:MAG: MSMEG_6728 family protein [Angustibacter sp.]
MGRSRVLRGGTRSGFIGLELARFAGNRRERFSECGAGSPSSRCLGRVVAVQTFVPYADLVASAAVLDDRRLGKQRVETLQVLRALALPDYGWQRHPAVLMWSGALPGLVAYGRAVVEAWTARGYADTTLEPITEFAPQVVGVGADELLARGLLPEWWGDDAVHRSHRSALVRKDPDHYGPVFPDADPDEPYVWPDGRPPAHPGRPEPHVQALWVVRPADDRQVAAMLQQGVVGLDAGCGVDVDACVASEPELVALLRERAPRRRPGKALRQLQALVLSMRPGDAVGLLGGDGAELVVGELAGDYRFWTPDDDALAALLHTRPVRWRGRIPRSAVRPPALLQDPRALFRVAADSRALARALTG